VNAFRIVLPLGVVAIIAGLIIGNTSVSLVSSQGIDCGSAFGGGSGSLDAYVQAACAPLLSERGMWATVFIVLGVGLLISSVVVYRASQPSRMPLPTMTLSPPPGATKRGWYPDPAGTGKQRYWNGKIWSDLPPR
jgi:hypothetical protein